MIDRILLRQACQGLSVVALLSSFITPAVASSKLDKRAGVISSNLPVNWTYTGCFTDDTYSPTLSAASYQNTTAMTQESCILFCAAEGFTKAGVEYMYQCFCGDDDVASRNASNTDCGMTCAGNTTEICGGGNRLTIFHSNQTSRAPITNPGFNNGTGDWNLYGCYKEGINGRALTTDMNNSPGGANNITVANCVNSCGALGFLLAGVEFANQCYCGNEFSYHSIPAVDGFKGCTTPCAGNATEVCGGADHLNMYGYKNIVPNPLNPPTGTTSTVTSTTVTPSNSMSSSGLSITSNFSSASIPGTSMLVTTGTSTTVFGTSSSTISSSAATASSSAAWSYLGCYSDNVNRRTLGNTYDVPGGGNNMTNEACQAVCLAKKFKYAGTEYSGQCYCDNSFKNGGGLANDGETQCSMTCNGNTTQICGGSNRLTMWGYNTGPPTSNPSSSTSSAPSSATSSAPLTIPSGWNYTGCWIDGANGRIIDNQQDDDQQLTIESCITTCDGLGYTVAGMEYGQQCFCDNFYRNGGVKTAETDCSMPCTGNAKEFCGNGGRINIYSKGTIQVFVPPVFQNASLPGNWTYAGCLTDDANNRSLKYRITNMMTNNTATNCLSLCSQFGYPAGGMEYATECYCGDLSDVTNAGATLRPESECNMACSGNSSILCGGPDRISYYTWGGSELYSWARPTGNEAGQYVFLIGGVTIPLITTQTITGKVTCLEKFGTSPANNGTGAYELDLAQISNFTGAWRPMHVKTDIFCAAGLTLPDKAGRQLNVGGWANEATYGIRLYWPDGTPGVWGKNDWQENVNEVLMQNGRWYPTAMMMANGSILIMGGEQGSNGVAVPTLEILPKAGPYKYCDYLARTDPNNLYPYLAVLPSGGIFVAYYNEARILNEVTLDTDRTLPNIPAAVNDFDGGRTYPFEGTSVLLPQYSPYDDALEIMICGGSTPGPEIAIDNCVTIAPDTPNANWTIERMPSSRVISCMTALPDGTYLILNGGQQGRAGFGLATNPNHNAVLYDPSKPFNHRMSVMANTTVSRLYHSEAILLQDGRVLVSGSDPEDVRFVQEYRNEVFLPPYLLSGIPQPNITVPNNDWVYGGSYTVQVLSSTTSSYRISLLGAESSTHGNSMGQRTLFPAVSCSGGSCTVTAPPNTHICPPGWYQLFLLDGPTPSHSVYVRIGGDPAGIGFWPDYPDFHPLPGPVLGA